MKTISYLPPILAVLNILVAYCECDPRQHANDLSSDSVILKRHLKKLKQKWNAQTPPVWIAKEKPEFNPEFPPLPYDSPTQDIQELHIVNKRNQEARRPIRSRNQGISDEICKTNRHWKQVNRTHDIYGQEINVVHTEDFRQFVFVYECTGAGEGCTGIAPFLASTCEMRTGWANMLHRKILNGHNSAPEWGYVAVPHHCACRISPRLVTTAD